MASPVREGEILAGKYRIERVLGEGGMGVVVAATHIHLDQKVAIKFLLPEALLNTEVVSRFAREARAAAKVQSEHVARVIDVSTLESGSPYMVMEYLEGEDLACALERVGRLPVGDAVDYLLQACEALAEAHAVGIVHRDLKPANLFLAKRADKTSIVKVLDFGISKATNAVGAMSDGVETKTSSLMGSPFYMSPEQLTSVKTVDARSDIWALGVILYELTTGLTPFYAETMPEIVAAILSAAPKPVREVEPSLPQAVAEVIHRCLLRDPKDRFANVGELANSLSEFSTGRSAKISAERISRVLGTESLASFGLQAPLSILGPSTGDSKPPPPSTAATSQIAPERASDASGLKASPATKVVGASTAASWGAGSGTHGPITDTDPKKKKPVLLFAGIVGACLAIGAAAILHKSDPPAGGSTGTTTTATTPSVTTPATVTTPPSIEKLATPDPVVPVPATVTAPGSATTAATAPTATAIKQPIRPTTTASAKPTAPTPPPSAAPPPSATAAKNPLQIQIK
jgi:serine/threonine protein kinase